MKITKKTITETTTDIEGKVYEGKIMIRDTVNNEITIKIKDGILELPCGSKILVIETEGMN